MIKAENLSYGFPDKDLYHNISFTLNNGDHCVLIGSNGTGKTTLADMMRRPDKYLFDGINLLLQCQKIPAEIVKNSDILIFITGSKLADKADTAYAVEKKFSVKKIFIRKTDHICKGGFSGSVAADQDTVVPVGQCKRNVMVQVFIRESVR